MVKHFADFMAGTVAGENKEISNVLDVVAGKLMYLQYEQSLKLWGSFLKAGAGAAGKIFVICSSFFILVPDATAQRDFYLSPRLF